MYYCRIVVYALGNVDRTFRNLPVFSLDTGLPVLSTPLLEVPFDPKQEHIIIGGDAIGTGPVDYERLFAADYIVVDMYVEYPKSGAGGQLIGGIYKRLKYFVTGVNLIQDNTNNDAYQNISFDFSISLDWWGTYFSGYDGAFNRTVMKITGEAVCGHRTVLLPENTQHFSPRVAPSPMRSSAGNVFSETLLSDVAHQDDDQYYALALVSTETQIKQGGGTGLSLFAYPKTGTFDGVDIQTAISIFNDANTASTTIDGGELGGVQTYKYDVRTLRVFIVPRKFFAGGLTLGDEYRFTTSHDVTYAMNIVKSGKAFQELIYSREFGFNGGDDEATPLWNATVGTLYHRIYLSPCVFYQSGLYTFDDERNAFTIKPTKRYAFTILTVWGSDGITVKLSANGRSIDITDDFAIVPPDTESAATQYNREISQKIAKVGNGVGAAVGVVNAVAGYASGNFVGGTIGTGQAIRGIMGLANGGNADTSGAPTFSTSGGALANCKMHGGLYIEFEKPDNAENVFQTTIRDGADLQGAQFDSAKSNIFEGVKINVGTNLDASKEYTCPWCYVHLSNADVKMNYIGEDGAEYKGRRPPADAVEALRKALEDGVRIWYDVEEWKENFPNAKGDFAKLAGGLSW